MIIYIKPSPNADSRTAKGKVSFEDFCKATDMHRQDVRNILKDIALRIDRAGELHDYTKKEKEEEFYKSFMAAKEEGKDFKKDDWYKYHTHTERHHIKSYVHDDINLIDVIEMIADCVAAGKARSGKVYDIDIDEKVLMKAFNNTVDLIMKETKIDN